jgi:hypothetical protein
MTVIKFSYFVGSPSVAAPLTYNTSGHGTGSDTLSTVSALLTGAFISHDPKNDLCSTAIAESSCRRGVAACGFSLIPKQRGWWPGLPLLGAIPATSRYSPQRGKRVFEDPIRQRTKRLMSYRL